LRQLGDDLAPCPRRRAADDARFLVVAIEQRKDTSRACSITGQIHVPSPHL
jgi:hypothetical protein